MTHRQQLAILAAALLSFIGVLTETSMNVTFPILVTQLQVPLATVSWLATGYLLVVTIVMGTTAYVLNRWPARRIFQVALAADVLGTVLCCAAGSFAVLMAGRVLQALATGLAIPLLFQLIFTLVPRQRLGVYTGFAEMLISLAPALGPTYGGALTAWVGWRFIFIGILPVLIAVGWLGWVTIAPGRSHPGTGFDLLGLALLAGVFTTLVWAFTVAGQRGFTTLRFWAWLAVALVLLAGVAWHARRGGRQLLDWRILRRPGLKWRLITYFLLQLINIGSSYVIPLLVEDGLGHDAMTAGLVLFPGALIGAIIAPLAGRWYDRSGLSHIILLSGGLVTLGAVLLALSTAQTSLVIIAGGFIVLRIGFNLGFGNSMSAANQLVLPANRADQNSLFNMLQQYAGSLGTGVMAAVIASAHGTATGSRWSFWLLAGLAMVAGLAAVAGNRAVATKK